MEVNARKASEAIIIRMVDTANIPIQNGRLQGSTTNSRASSDHRLLYEIHRNWMGAGFITQKRSHSTCLKTTMLFTISRLSIVSNPAYNPCCLFHDGLKATARLIQVAFTGYTANNSPVVQTSSSDSSDQDTQQCNKHKGPAEPVEAHYMTAATISSGHT